MQKLVDSLSTPPYLDAMPGASEERTEMYLTYIEGVTQLATPQRAKSRRCSRLCRLAGRRYGGVA